MKKRSTLIQFVAVAAVALVALSVWPASAPAQDEGASQQRTRKTPAMREKVYKVLSEAQLAAEAGNVAEATNTLERVRRMNDLNSYELAQMWNFYGFIYFDQENYSEAARAYKNVLAQPDLPEAMESSTRYTLAQLNFVMENYAGALEQLNIWFRTANNPGAEAYIMVGQAHYQLGNFREAVEPVKTAIQLTRNAGKPVKENWLLLLRTFYFELKDYPNMTAILEELLQKFPKKEYWLQLSAIYGEQGQETKQLVAYELAYMQGFLTQGREHVTLAQLFLQGNVPNTAARILAEGIENGIIESTAANYRLLSQAWSLAQEDEKAIPSLQQAARLSGDGEMYVRLAQAYANLERYEDAVSAGREALNRGGVKRPDSANVLIGMSLYELGQYVDAKKAFVAAQSDSRSAKLARQWASHMDKEQERLAQLAAAMKQ